MQPVKLVEETIEFGKPLVVYTEETVASTSQVKEVSVSKNNFNVRCNNGELYQIIK